MLVPMSALWLLLGLLLGAGATSLAFGARRRRQGDGRAEVQALVAPLGEQLGRIDRHLLRLDRERHELRGSLEAQIQSLVRSGERLHSETSALVSALRRPNTRGQWGQMQLRRVVELAGMVAHCDFTEQVRLEGEDGALRPDLIVALPGEKQVVVDAKAPLGAVLDLYACQDESERGRHLRAHARLLRGHMEALAGRNYAACLAASPDFVVLFLPGEHLYSVALEADPALLEDAMTRRVLIATPTTLLAILRAVAYGWQQERVARSAQELAELGGELQRRLARLAGLLEAIGSRLSATVRAYNETVGSYEARVLPAARRFAEHGVGSPEQELEVPQPVSVVPRRRSPLEA